METIFRLNKSEGDKGLVISETADKQTSIRVLAYTDSGEIHLTDSELRGMVDVLNVYLINIYDRQQASDYQSRILDSCRKLRVDRAKEYNNGVSVDTYMAFGTKSYFTFIWTKILRLKSLISKPNNRYEGLLDSIYDGINYLLFFGAWILQQLDQGKEGDSVDICCILDEADPATRDFVAKYLESIKGVK